MSDLREHAPDPNPHACPRHGTIVSDGIVSVPCPECEDEERGE